MAEVVGKGFCERTCVGFSDGLCGRVGFGVDGRLFCAVAKLVVCREFVRETISWYPPLASWPGTSLKGWGFAAMRMANG